MKRIGFSLIELLCVVSIIAAIMAILLPVLHHAMAGSRRAVCLSNIAQVSHALLMYTNDYDGFFPPAVAGEIPISQATKPNNSWHIKLNPYIKDEFPYCPSRTTPLYALWKKELLPQLSGYAFNFQLNRRMVIQNRQGKAVTFPSKSETQVWSPSLTVAVAEARTGIIATATVDIGKTPEEMRKYAAIIDGRLSSAYTYRLPPGATRHHEGANYVFLDGHAKWYRPEAFKSLSENTRPRFKPE
jgi:prepilin-type N-terminal cleavage/methylation domain-containing protein/prepilin-type processing-associated H-X9-DG protein